MNLFEAAEYARSLSTCLKRPVGASLAVNGEVVSIGFNHSDQDCSCYMNQENPNVEHAEVHCLKHFESLKDECAELAVTYLCCLNCAKYITEKGVKTVFIKEFRSDKMAGVHHLQANNIQVLGWIKEV